MRKVLNITLKDLVTVFKDKMTYVWLFLTPLVLISIFGLALGGIDENMETKVPVLYRSGDPSAKMIVEELKDTGIVKVVKRPVSGSFTEEVRKVKSEVGSGDYVAALVFPGNVEELLSKNQTVGMKIYRVDEKDARVQAVMQAVYEAVYKTVAIKAMSGQASYGPPPVAVRQLTARETRSANNFNQYVPGYAVMFMLFAVMEGIMFILEEREKGTLRRLFLTPVSGFGILLGKEISVLVMTMIQGTVLFVAGWLFFKINVTNNPAAIVLIVLSTAIAAAGLGTLLSVLIKEMRQVSGITVFTILVMSALGGSWWPLWMMPKWLQAISWFTINGWSMNAFNKIMVFNNSFMSIVPNCLVLLAMGTVAFGIGVALFKAPE